MSRFTDLFQEPELTPSQEPEKVEEVVNPKPQVKSTSAKKTLPKKKFTMD